MKNEAKYTIDIEKFESKIPSVLCTMLAILLIAFYNLNRLVFYLAGFLEYRESIVKTLLKK